MKAKNIRPGIWLKIVEQSPVDRTTWVGQVSQHRACGHGTGTCFSMKVGEWWHETCEMGDSVSYKRIRKPRWAK